MANWAGSSARTRGPVADLLSRPWEDADAFVNAVLESGSLPLIDRLMIALRAVRERNNPTRSAWAQRLLKDRVVPAVKDVVTAGLEGARDPVA